MFINVNDCFPVTIETHMLAADLESTALRIDCAKQEFHGLMNSWKWGLGITSKSWQLFFPHRNYCKVETIELYLVGGIKHEHEQKKY